MHNQQPRTNVARASKAFRRLDMIGLCRSHATQKRLQEEEEVGLSNVLDFSAGECLFEASSYCTYALTSRTARMLSSLRLIASEPQHDCAVLGQELRISLSKDVDKRHAGPDFLRAAMLNQVIDRSRSLPSTMSGDGTDQILNIQHLKRHQKFAAHAGDVLFNDTRVLSPNRLVWCLRFKVRSFLSSAQTRDKTRRSYLH